MSFQQGCPLGVGVEGTSPHAVGSLGQPPVRVLPVGLAGVQRGGRVPLGRAEQGQDPSVLPQGLPQPCAVLQGRFPAFLLVRGEGGDSRGLWLLQEGGRHSQGIPAATARAPRWHFHLNISSSC